MVLSESNVVIEFFSAIPDTCILKSLCRRNIKSVSFFSLAPYCAYVTKFAIFSYYIPVCRLWKINRNNLHD